MNPNDLLSQLRDVHSPVDISWWPLAIGWWLSGALILILIITMAVFLVKKYKANSWRRTALAELKDLKSRYLDSPNTILVSQMNALLKRSISSHTNDHQFLSKTGDAWAKVLKNPQNIPDEKIKPLLTEELIKQFCFGQYALHTEHMNKSDLSSIEKWIRRLH